VGASRRLRSKSPVSSACIIVVSDELLAAGRETQIARNLENQAMM
jgi:hypothetical protein